MTLTNNQQLLYAAVTDIDEKYVEEALRCKRKAVPTAVKRFAAVAATIILLLSLPYLLNILQAKEEGATLTDDGVFIIKVAAKNDKTLSVDELEKLASALAPGHSPEPMFGDHVIFDLELISNQLTIDDFSKSNYTVKVSYGDKIVEPAKPNENMCIFHTPTGYILSGWFEEPTDLTITFYMTASGEIVQEQVIRVEFDSKMKTYSFTVRNN